MFPCATGELEAAVGIEEDVEPVFSSLEEALALADLGIAPTQRQNPIAGAISCGGRHGNHRLGPRLGKPGNHDLTESNNPVHVGESLRAFKAFFPGILPFGQCDSQAVVAAQAEAWFPDVDLPEIDNVAFFGVEGEPAFAGHGDNSHILVALFLLIAMAGEVTGSGPGTFFSKETAILVEAEIEVRMAGP